MLTQVLRFCGGAVIALSTTSSAVTAAEDCQARLVASIARMTASGPMRAVRTILHDGKPALEETTEFVPPNSVRKKNRSLLSAAEQKAQMDAFASNPLFAELARAVANADSSQGNIVFIGPHLYVGNEKTAYPDLERVKLAPSQLRELADFADPSLYFALSCTATAISFEYDAYSINMSAEDEGKVRSPAQINAYRRSQRQEAEQSSGRRLPVPTGMLTLDASSRPMKISRTDEAPDPEIRAMVAKMLKGVKLAEPNAQSFIYQLTYDSSITIEVPK